jgi:hypothetical protein
MRGGRGAESCDSKKAWSSINQSMLSARNPNSAEGGLGLFTSPGKLTHICAVEFPDLSGDAVLLHQWFLNHISQTSITCLLFSYYELVTLVKWN